MEDSVLGSSIFLMTAKSCGGFSDYISRKVAKGAKTIKLGGFATLREFLKTGTIKPGVGVGQAMLAAQYCFSFIRYFLAKRLTKKYRRASIIWSCRPSFSGSSESVLFGPLA